MKKVTRRSFIRKSAGAGAASFLGSSLLAAQEEKKTEAPAIKEIYEMTVVMGEDRSKSTRKAMEFLGGMERFVKKGEKVCILPNSQKNNPGTYTHPDLVRTVVKLCLEAGAKEVNCLSWLPVRCWEATGLKKAVEEAGGHLKIVDMKDETLFKLVPIPKGKSLKEARIMKLFYEMDRFITLPICKDHAGNRFTGTLKNMMGLNSPKSNRSFHTGNFKNDDIEFLDQCIADLNMVVKPDLCIVDAFSFIITNGPFGPGKLKKPKKVVAGTDRVSIDAYCATLWDLKPEEIIMIQQGYKHKLGEIDFKKKKMKETVL